MAEGTELAKAYVQIVPSAKGFRDALADEVGEESEKAGSSFGSKMVGAIKGAIAAAGIGTFLKQTISEGADLQQSLGGIETLFKDNADTVKAYANEAYKTAGLSANAYMETVTSFSASLLQSMGGDTAAAAEAANQALIDMSDNANKMGTDMESIQTAYQGFAKQNYTMLDNLKLGYGGTKSEMERLLADAQKLSGVEYNIDNLSDVYAAIHVVQDELNITGTTAKEASTTFAGSMGAMKAAASNLLGSLALGQDITPALEGLLETVVVFLTENLLPMVTDILLQIPDLLIAVMTDGLPMLIDVGIQAITTLALGIAEALPELIPAATQAIADIVTVLINNLPMLLDAALQIVVGLANGILAAIPVLLDALPAVISGIVNFLLGAIPQIIEAGITLLTSLVEALPEIISTIVTVLPQIIDGIVTAIVENVPLIIDAGIKLLTALVGALPEIIAAIVDVLPQVIEAVIDAIVGNIPLLIDTGVKLFSALIENLPAIIAALVGAIPQIIEALVSGFGEFLGAMADVGMNLITGIWNGISDAATWLWDKLSGWCDDLLGKIKGFFGIHSPSKETAWMGEMLVAGLAGSIDQNGGKAIDAAGDMASGILGAMNSLEEGVDFSGAIKSATDDLENVRLSAKIQSSLTADTSLAQSGSETETDSGISIVINISNFVNNGKEDIEELADTLAEELMFRVQQKEAALT